MVEQDGKQRRKRILIQTTSEIIVQLMQQAGNDAMVLAAARTSSDPSTAKLALQGSDDPEKVIRSLLRHRHGSPFEHGLMTHFVDAPIFVWREHHRHRIGWSYSEESARYVQLRPKFWVPKPGRPVMKPEGFRAMRPKMEQASDITYVSMVEWEEQAYQEAWNAYIDILGLGVASEVARSVLPVSVYSRGWTTCNPRSMMHFLGLRTHEPNSQFVSYPQAEIEEVARQYEESFAKYWPITYKYFNEFGRVAP